MTLITLKLSFCRLEEGEKLKLIEEGLKLKADSVALGLVVIVYVSDSHFNSHQQTKPSKKNPSIIISWCFSAKWEVLIRTWAMLRNIGLASPFRANNLQIRRSNFWGVVKLYFTVLKVTLVLVNNARHLLQCEVRRQI